MRTKSSNNRIINFMVILGLFVFSMSGCQQVNDIVNSNKAANSNTTANSNANTTSNANSNVAANSNANANTSVVPSNSAANTNNQASNTAANTATDNKAEVPLTPEAKAFAFSLIGEWDFGGDRKVTFAKDTYEVKQGNRMLDKGSYRVLNENTVEINSVQQKNKWNATMKVEDGGNKLDWQQRGTEHYTLTRVKPN